GAGALEHALGEVDAGDLVAVGRELQRDVPGAGADVQHRSGADGQGICPDPGPGRALVGMGEAGELVLVVLERVPGPVLVPAVLVLGGGAGHRRGSSEDGAATGAVSSPAAPVGAAASGGAAVRPRNRNCTTPSSAEARCAATS